jgi:hypothetical protein
MTTLEITKPLAMELERISAETDTASLLKEFDCAVLGGVELWIKAAAIWKRIKTLNPDSTIRCDLSRYLERLNIPGRPGPLLPELFSAKYATPTILNRAMRYSFEDQRTLADDLPLPIYLETGDCRMISPSVMRRSEQQQVFGRDGIRGEGEQLAWIREQKELKSSKESTDTDPPVCISKKTQQLIVKGYAIGLKQLLQYASELQK